MSALGFAFVGTENSDMGQSWMRRSGRVGMGSTEHYIKPSELRASYMS